MNLEEVRKKSKVVRFVEKIEKAIIHFNEKRERKK
jgi:hypothetical protein